MKKKPDPEMIDKGKPGVDRRHVCQGKAGARAKVEYKRASQPFAHTSIVGEYKAKVNTTPQFLRSGTSSTAGPGAADRTRARPRKRSWRNGNMDVCRFFCCTFPSFVRAREGTLRASRAVATLGGPGVPWPCEKFHLSL
jgi:hypothetical protein